MSEDLQHVWNKLDADKLSKQNGDLVPPCTKSSRHPVQKLLHAFQSTLAFTTGFGLVFFGLIFLFEPMLIRLLLSVMVIIYILAGIYNLRVYHSVKNTWNKLIDASVKENLQQIHQLVHRSIRFQERVALFVYPVSASTGYFMGLYAGSQSKFEQNLSNGLVIVILIVATAILTPLCYYFAKWMYKLSYDKYLLELNNMLHELSYEEKA